MVLSSISAAESGITPFYFLYLLYLLKFSILFQKILLGFGYSFKVKASYILVHKGFNLIVA